MLDTTLYNDTPTDLSAFKFGTFYFSCLSVSQFNWSTRSTNNKVVRCYVLNSTLCLNLSGPQSTQYECEMLGELLILDVKLHFNLTSTFLFCNVNTIYLLILLVHKVHKRRLNIEISLKTHNYFKSIKNAC